MNPVQPVFVRKEFSNLATMTTALLSAAALFSSDARAETDVYLLDVPDYDWYAGCFGTACGNLAGYWDRNGFPNFYTGPTSEGIAPLDSYNKNAGIRSMWASRAGFDGRPADKPGHIDDYWRFYSDLAYSYEDPSPDPYVTDRRREHTPDCIGDFIGLSQRKWKKLADECDGNIDGYSFVFWDRSGNPRINFKPQAPDGSSVTDIPSGLREWARFRGYDADTISQLADVNSNSPGGMGFTYADLKAEIDAGYPVLIYLQPEDVLHREIDGERLNPHIHGMLAYGYFIGDDGSQMVRLRSSWADGSNYFQPWSSALWTSNNQLRVRGVICFHPLPFVTGISRDAGTVTISWQGPSARLHDAVTGDSHNIHSYVIERSTNLNPPRFEPVSGPVSGNAATFADCCEGTAFFRIRLVTAVIGTSR